MSSKTPTPENIGQSPQHRNTAGVIEHSSAHFDAAHFEGLMALYGLPLSGRRVELSPGTTESRTIVDFVRCSYLGLDNHPKIVAGAVAALEAYGTLHWSCARTRLNFSLMGDLESSLSDLFNARVITYSTVLAANMGALPILASGQLTGGIKPLMAFDRFAHTTLAFHKAAVATETEVVTIGHNDMDALEKLCRSRKAVAYIGDGVYSMGGASSIGRLLQLQQQYGLFLYIDDAHCISIFGANGEGFARSRIEGALGNRTIIAASLGKGFGASGGLLMLGTARQEEIFRRYAVAHAFSASVNVAAIGAALASQALHRTRELPELQRTLQERVALLDSLVETDQKGSELPIRTVELGNELIAIGAARYLLDQGFYTSAIFFPTVAKGRAGLRICVTAGHSPDEIKAVCAALNAVKKEARTHHPSRSEFNPRY